MLRRTSTRSSWSSPPLQLRGVQEPCHAALRGIASASCERLFAGARREGARSDPRFQDGAAAAKVDSLLGAVVRLPQVDEIEVGIVHPGAPEVRPAEVGDADLFRRAIRLVVVIVGVEPAARALGRLSE